MPIPILQYGVKVRDPTTQQFSDLAALRGGQGPTGPGVPAGGTDGDVLVKDGATDYAAKWTNTPSQMGSLAYINTGSAADKTYYKGDYLVYNGQLYKVGSTAISQGQTLTPGGNIEAVSVGDGFMPKENVVNIGAECQTPTGTITFAAYIKLGKVVYITVFIERMQFVAGQNIWVKLPDSFPGNPVFFSALATGFPGMVCVFRTQSGSGKYLLAQCTTSNTLNLSASGICLC